MLTGFTERFFVFNDNYERATSVILGKKCDSWTDLIIANAEAMMHEEHNLTLHGFLEKHQHAFYSAIHYCFATIKLPIAGGRCADESDSHYDISIELRHFPFLFVYIGRLSALYSQAISLQS